MGEDNKTWLGLGLDEIDQSLFLTNAANNILSYIQSKPWSEKRKQNFFNAYQAIMNSGVTGATNTSGQWEVTTLRKLDRENLSRRDEEMLNDAAYYILTLMQTVSPRSTEVSEIVTPKTKFDGSLAFENWLSNNYFAGNDIDRVADWNILDDRDPETGKRGVANRLARMRERLIEFRNTINDTDWDFEGNESFHNATEVLLKIDKAISALTGKTELDLDIIDSLNAIGIRYRDWFDNGLGEDSGEIDSSTGLHLTVGDLLRRQEEQKLAEELIALKKALEEKEKINLANTALLSNPWYNFYILKPIDKLWTDLQLADLLGDRKLVDVLNKYSTQMGNLNLGLRMLVQSAYRSKNIPKTLISDEEYAMLKRKQLWLNSEKSQFLKIAGVEGIIYDTKTLTLLYPSATLGFQTSNMDPNTYIQSQSTEALKKQAVEKEKLDKLKNRENASLRLVHEEGVGWDFKPEDYVRMAAMALDIASAVAAYAGVATEGAGTLVSGGLGITSMLTDLGADIIDDSVSPWQVAKNAGINTVLGVAGMFPGVASATKGGKWVKNIAKWGPRLLLMSSIKDVPEVWDSIKKATLGKDLTNEDWKNIAYGLAIASGASRMLSSKLISRKYQPIIKNSTLTEEHIVTKNGKRIEANEKDVKKINKAAEEASKKAKKEGKSTEEINKAAEEAANKKLRELKSSATEKDELKLNSELKVELVRNTIPNERVKKYAEIVKEQRPKQYERYMKNANSEYPFLNLRVWLAVKNWWNPVESVLKNHEAQVAAAKLLKRREKISSVVNTKSASIDKPIRTKITKEKFKAHTNKNIELSNKRNYNKAIDESKSPEERFSKRLIKEGTYKFGSDEVMVVKNQDGTYSLTSKNYNLDKVSSDNIKTTIAKIMKNTENSIRHFAPIRKLGWLKQGGKTLTVDEIVSNFLSKLK